MIAFIVRAVLFEVVIFIPGAAIKGTIEGLFLINPDWWHLLEQDLLSGLNKLTLEVAIFVFSVARESDLRLLFFEQLQYHAIRYIAHLKVFVDNQPLFVTDTSLAVGHEFIAGGIRVAH